jgi:predicted small secreted protein
MKTKLKQTVLRTLLAAGLAGGALALTACNTVKGAGTDLQKASENTEKAIEKATN